MRTGIAHRVDRVFAGWFCEQRLFLKSDRATRFLRLRPAVQAAGIAATGLILAWTVVATAMLMTDALGAGGGRAEAALERASFEARLDALARERDAALAEAAAAERRFAHAMAEVAAMQTRLLGSEELRREAETGLEVVQATLRRAIRDRDAARGEAAGLRAELASRGGTGSTAARAGEEATAILAAMTHALGVAAEERDIVVAEARQARAEADIAALERRLLEERNAEIFARLEQAVNISMEPLGQMFRTVGLRSEDVLRELRRGAAPAESVAALRFSTKGGEEAPDKLRANALLDGFDRIALYRAAVARVPFAMPVRGNYRFTSGFGFRRDPKTGRNRMHAGADFAAPRGTAIYATADGIVTEAGWHAGFGNMVTIRHAFGIETLYAHLSKIRVREGQRVSRGDRIGDMGSTGRSTGTHLHYEVRIGGRPVNPMTYIRAATNVF
jgi:murein DD-endopeptidase MepM/ murein hydrolase activator NlpD